MASSPIPECFADAPPIAAEVARGVTRLFCRHDHFAMCEVPLPNGRRADLMAVGPKGELTIVEIKVSRADLLADQKWTDYLDYCDRFFWAVPQFWPRFWRKRASCPNMPACWWPTVMTPRSCENRRLGRSPRPGEKLKRCGSRAGLHADCRRKSTLRLATASS